MYLHEDDVERGEGCRQAQDVQDGRHKGGLAFFIDSHIVELLIVELFNCLIVGTHYAFLQDHSLRKDFTGFTVAARKLRKVTTAIVTAKTANSAKTNTQTCNVT